MADSYRTPLPIDQLDRDIGPPAEVLGTDSTPDASRPETQHHTEQPTNLDNAGYASGLRESRQYGLEPDLSDTEASTIVPNATARNSLSEEVLQAESAVDEAPSPASAGCLSRGGTLPMHKSLGIWGCLVVLGGSFGAFVGLGFLIFLWTAHGSDSEAADAPRAWRAIALGGWMSQAITLTALLIRTVATTQATVCTAMLASLILEKRKVQKSQAAQFSVMRGINEGPFKLLRLLLPSGRGILYVEALLVFALTLSTFSLQFSTTILFFDVHDRTIVGDTTPVRVMHYYTGPQADSFYVSGLLLEAPVYPVYGEVPSNWSSAPDSLGFSDSGLKQRSFLPFDKEQNRTAIRRLEGDSATMNSRVACMRPELDGLYQGVVLPSSFESEKIGTGRINGTLHYGRALRDAHSTPALCDSRKCQSASFSCSMPAAEDGYLGYQSAFCSITAAIGVYPDRAGIVEWEVDNDPWDQYSLVQLVYSNNVPESEWPTLTEPRELASVPKTDYGEWVSFELLPGRFLNISLCFLAYNIRVQNLEMTTHGSLHEPSGNWSLLGIGDSWGIRSYLGTDPLHTSPEERGLLTMQRLRQPEMNHSEPGDSGERINKTWLDFQALLQGSLSLNTGAEDPAWDPAWAACAICNFVGGAALHPELAMIFGDTLTATGRAAEAVQSFMTAFSLIAYTEFYKNLAGTTELHVSSLQMVQLPQLCSQDNCRGLISAASLLGFHLICVLLTSALFVRQVRYSRQGNIWHAISQVMGDELDDVLEKANNIDDKDVAKVLKKLGNNSSVKLEECEGGLISFVVAPDNSHESSGRRLGGWSPGIPGFPTLGPRQKAKRES